MGHAILQIQRAISLIINTHFFKSKTAENRKQQTNNKHNKKILLFKLLKCCDSCLI